MKKDLNDIYAKISAMIIKGIEDHWSEAVLEVELHALAIGLSGGYLRSVGAEPSPFTFQREDKKTLINTLIELHLQTDQDEQNCWNTMSYHLHTDGRYKVDFSWNQELADDIERVRAAG